MTPLILNILNIESQIGQGEIEIEEDYTGKVSTNAPDGLLKLFSEAFEIVRVKKIKELVLMMLEIYQGITTQFQQALSKFFTAVLKKDPPVDISFLIAQCNNFFRFWQLFQDLINPVLQEKIATDEEIQASYNERTVIQEFNAMQDTLIAAIN